MNDEILTVPYIVYEGEMARQERMVKRLFIALIFSVFVILATKRDRSIMKDRLINGMRFEPLAEKYDLSVAQVKRITYKYSDYIFNLR